MTPERVQELPGRGIAEALSGVRATSSPAEPDLSRLHLDQHGVLSLEIKAWEWMNTRPAEALHSLEPGLEPSGSRATDLTGRVEELIRREVVTIRRLHAETLTVVLRPDAQTELVLQLQQQQGTVEAFVRCPADTYDRLQGGWTQLQDTLAQMNVRLLPLRENPGADYQNQNQNQNQNLPERSAGQALPDPRQDQRREPARAEIPDPLRADPELRRHRPTSAAPADPARRSRLNLWETWA